MQLDGVIDGVTGILFTISFFFTACVNKKYAGKYNAKELLDSLNQKCRDAKVDINIE